MKIEMDKKYTTRDGRPVRILCVDGPGPQPVLGLVEGAQGPASWSPDGKFCKGDIGAYYDLIPAKPEPVVEWGYELPDRPWVMQTLRSEKEAREACAYGRPARLMRRTTEIIEP